MGKSSERRITEKKSDKQWTFETIFASWHDSILLSNIKGEIVRTILNVNNGLHKKGPLEIENKIDIY